MLRQPRVRLPLPLVITFLVIILLCMIIMSLGVGARNITSPDILAALRHYGDPTNSHIIWGRRIPRTLIAIAAGASLSLAGVLIQALTRNPLADTGVFGINAGAAFTIVIGIALAGSLSHISIFALALLGAILAGACVYALSMNSCKGSDPLRLVLAGVALSAILTGIGDGLSLVNPQAFDRLKSWMVGNIDAGSYQPAAVAGVGLILGILVTATCMRQLNALSLGDELAITMGASIAKTRLFTFIAIVVLAASATAAAGVITFLGLMVPHIARWIVGPNLLRLVATASLIGPIIVLSADILGRIIVPGEFPAGVVVAFIGAPFLIAYAQTKRKEI
ncbi:iron chelate uptake ABC transporter family permease subunit [Corynebacterium diphtheriae bv. mitis]|uniref:Iron-siderophore uptake system protein n=2 Tax=Corynebacterium diphtheriae TaxID=1717 RepID=A0A0D6FYF8_CORDP|nr:iron chelate uptake ABC transporter family permease subunit [Corynebacterium diphtheriae]ERA56075.1 iron-siderophore uptake system transmembrane component [Corynebacterium diphtheriae DSM 43988]OWN11549.1 iron-siderophore transporter permease [Corynebacterium belfantii]AEX41743.1 iron-siderophore uptake system transmembrane component [Corynebacterium diphtheriae 31A]AEX46243.1 iron-siderophore uptake system transmembrane component [Corynebacterium diphtheriae INCA 402]AEX67175.1 iron-sidero